MDVNALTDNSDAARSVREAEYYGLATAWDEELYASLRKSRKLAWIVTGVSLAMASMSVFAVAMLTPLKETQPYVISIDESSGYLQELRQLDRSAVLTEQEAIVQAQLVSYVVTFETFDAADRDRRNNINRLTSDTTVRTQYIGRQSAYGEEFNTNVQRLVNIKSVSLDDEFSPNDPTVGRALIRFSTNIVIRGQKQEAEHWIANISYSFVDLNITNEERFINPLGFIVTSYRVDPETV